MKNLWKRFCFSVDTWCTAHETMFAIATAAFVIGFMAGLLVSR